MAPMTAVPVDPRILETIAGFPERFRFRGHPGDVFTIDPHASRIHEGLVVLAIAVQDGETWRAVAECHAGQLLREILRIPKRRP
jgi:hypothetical protein